MDSEKSINLVETKMYNLLDNCVFLYSANNFSETLVCKITFLKILYTVNIVLDSCLAKY